MWWRCLGEAGAMAPPPKTHDSCMSIHIYTFAGEARTEHQECGAQKQKPVAHHTHKQCMPWCISIERASAPAPPGTCTCSTCSCIMQYASYGQRMHGVRGLPPWYAREQRRPPHTHPPVSA